MSKRWVTVMTHRGRDILVLTPAESHEIGYYVDGKRFNLVQHAVDYIDRIKLKHTIDLMGAALHVSSMIWDKDGFEKAVSDYEALKNMDA